MKERSVGPYRVIRSLGKGGMAEVFEVEHRHLGVRRALKVFDASGAKDAYPWETPPVRLVVPMVRAPQAYAAEPERQEKNTAPVANPVAVGRDAALEDVELVPFGATCLRLACFPLAN